MDWKGKKGAGILLVLGTAVISGFSIFLNKYGVTGINSDIFTFSKNILVAIMLFSIIWLIHGWKEFGKLGKKDWLSLGLVGLIGGSIPFVLFFKGLQMTDAASGSFIQKLMFLFVAFFSVMFLKEKLGWKIAVPAAFLVAGNLLLLKFSIGIFAVNAGNIMILAATIFWAAENTLSKYLLKDMNPKILAFGRMFFGSIFIFAYLVLAGEAPLLARITAPQLAWIALTSVLLLGYVLTWYSGLKNVKATTAAAILLLGSPITSMLQYFFSGTALSPSQVLGTFMVLAGAALAVYFLEAGKARFAQLQSHGV